MFAALALAFLGYFVTDAPVAARDSNSVIQVMLAELGQRRPENCPGRWCACYLDNALARAGLSPHGTNLASDFADYGAPAEPGQIGAIMVMSNHVGVVVGTCENGQVQIVSGNYSNRVALGCYSASRAIAWRAPLGA